MGRTREDWEPKVQIVSIETFTAERVITNDGLYVRYDADHWETQFGETWELVTDYKELEEKYQEWKAQTLIVG